jgi:hypothetical protein
VSRPTCGRGQGSGHQFRGSSPYQKNVTQPDPPDECVPSHRFLVWLRVKRWQDLPPFPSEVVPSQSQCPVLSLCAKPVHPAQCAPQQPGSLLLQRASLSIVHTFQFRSRPMFYERVNNSRNFSTAPGAGIPRENEASTLSDRCRCKSPDPAAAADTRCHRPDPRPGRCQVSPRL